MVRQDQDRRDLQGPKCKPEALQASDVILYSQVSTLPRDCQDAPLADTHLQNTDVPAFAVI